MAEPAGKQGVRVICPGAERTCATARDPPGPRPKPQGEPILDHRFEHLASGEIGEVVARKSLLILGLGTIEEHGDHLPTGTDLFITQRFMDDLTSALEKETEISFLTLPAIWTGYSG